jgi:septation ring formation regulator EzrA
MYIEQFKIYFNMVKTYISIRLRNIKDKIDDFSSIPDNLENIRIDIQKIEKRMNHLDDSVTELKEIDFVAIGR